MKLIVKTELSTQTFAQTPKVMSYILQQKHHMYINYDVNRLANVWLHNSEKKTHTNIAGSCQNETNLSSFRNRVKIFLDFSHFPVIFTTKPILY